MTITLQEVARLRELLAAHAPTRTALPKRYYRAVAKIADKAWFVVREQNLRFPWIKDVEKKRPFYFRALTGTWTACWNWCTTISPRTESSSGSCTW